MRKFITKLARTEFGIQIRELFRIYPPLYKLNYDDSFISSDLFFWQADDVFSTIFKASDILGKYYDCPSKLVLLFYDKEGNHFLTREYDFSGGLANVLINKELLNRSGYGTFSALNIATQKLDQDVHVTNRCYVGYGRNGEYSMVHGNLIALKSDDIYNIRGQITSLTPAISSAKGRYKYVLQRQNLSDHEITLIFTNPLNRKIKIVINKNAHYLNSKECRKIKITNNKQLISIESNFIFPRPLVFCEKEDFLDVHHG